MALVGFEDITEDIKDSEIEIAHLIACQLKKRPAGKKDAATGKKIREALLKHKGIKIDDVRMRRIIQYIRSHNLVRRLCSTQTGYFVAANDEEWENWKESMRQRIRQQEYTLFWAIRYGDEETE